MELQPLLIAGLLLLGLATGFMAGLLGIGGGMLMVPFVMGILGQRGIPPNLAIKMAISTSMATIMFTSIASVRAHHLRGAVRWDLVRRLAPGIVLGAALASLGVFSILKGAWLGACFALFVGYSATRMLIGSKSGSTRQVPGAPGMLAAGGAIGFLSGLVGAGGAFVSVPFMTWCNVAIHQAIATSAALGFPISLANAVGYAISGQGLADRPSHALGYIWLPALLAIATGSVLTAPLGARVAHRLPVGALRRVFAVLLYLLTGYMLYKALRHA